MTKRILMIVGLAVFTGAGLACYGMGSKARHDPERPAVADPCAGLDGQARIDCEKRKASEPY